MSEKEKLSAVETSNRVSRRGALLGAAAVAGGVALGSGGTFLGLKATADPTPNAAAAETQARPNIRMNASDTTFTFIDYQVTILEASPSRPAKDIVNAAIRLQALCATFNLPAIFTSSQEEEEQDPFVPDLIKVLPTQHDQRIKRLGVADSFDDPAYTAAIEKTNRKNLVIAGLSTETCVAQAAITAVRKGYNVKVIADACATPTVFGDTIQFQRMLHYGVDVTTVKQIVADIVVNYGAPQTNEYNALVKANLI